MRPERFEEFSYLISGIHGNIQKLKGRYTAQLGLKPVHVFWLYLLRVHPEGMSASELAAASRSDRSLVSRELEALLEAGIVATRQDGGRRRYGWKLTLTHKGRELADIISAVAKNVQDTVNRDIPEDDLLVFYRTLNALSDGFDKLFENNTIQETIDHERNADK